MKFSATCSLLSLLEFMPFRVQKKVTKEMHPATWGFALPGVYAPWRVLLKTNGRLRKLATLSRDSDSGVLALKASLTSSRFIRSFFTMLGGVTMGSFPE